MKPTLLLFTILHFHCLFAQKSAFATQKDSVFTFTGDTLVGKITIDKDNNQYIFKRKNSQEEEILSPKLTLRFTILSDDGLGEIKQFFCVLETFFMLEFGKNDAITVYAKYKYNKITNDGPTYYTIKKDYCLFKSTVPYFPRFDTLKEDLLVLTADCFKVNQKIKNQKVKIEDLPIIIIEYNHCNY